MKSSVALELCPDSQFSRTSLKQADEHPPTRPLAAGGCGASFNMRTCAFVQVDSRRGLLESPMQDSEHLTTYKPSNPIQSNLKQTNLRPRPEIQHHPPIKQHPRNPYPLVCRFPRAHSQILGCACHVYPHDLRPTLKCPAAQAGFQPTISTPLPSPRPLLHVGTGVARHTRRLGQSPLRADTRLELRNRRIRSRR